MAAVAIRRCIFEAQRFVTRGAFDEVMPPAEREPALVVVEGDLLPRCLPMARVTLCSLLSLVLVVLLVAGSTVGRCLVSVEVTLVALLASLPGVFTQ